MVQAYSQRIFAGMKPVFDGRKNLYSRDPLPVGREKVSRQSNSLNSILCQFLSMFLGSTLTLSML